MERPPKRGNPRKSRRARLPTSFMAGSFDFKPTEADWRRIETAYPFVSLGDRDEISQIATDYLLFAPFESRAPFLDDAMAWLAELEKAADKSWKAGHKRPVTEEKELAAVYARCLVERNIRHWALPRGNEWSVLSGIMTHVVAAFDITKRELLKEAVAGHVEGQMWDNLVCRLTDFAEKRGYRLGASKGVVRALSGRMTRIPSWSMSLIPKLGSSEHPGAELAGVAKSPASACYNTTNPSPLGRVFLMVLLVLPIFSPRPLRLYHSSSNKAVHDQIMVEGPPKQRNVIRNPWFMRG